MMGWLHRSVHRMNNRQILSILWGHLTINSGTYCRARVHRSYLNQYANCNSTYHQWRFAFHNIRFQVSLLPRLNEPLQRHVTVPNHLDPPLKLPFFSYSKLTPIILLCSYHNIFVWMTFLMQTFGD